MAKRTKSLAALPTNPETREERYLNSIATENTAVKPSNPETRVERYLDYICDNVGGSISATREQSFTPAQQAQAIANLGKVDLAITYDDDSTATLTVAGYLTPDEAEADADESR